MTNASNRDLNQLDLMIIRELEKDARKSFVTLAKQLDTTSTTVYRRFKRMLKEGIIEIHLVPNSHVLGFNTHVLFGIKSRLEAVDAVADQLASLKSVHHVLIATGRYDIHAWATLKSPDHLPKFIMEELGSIPDIVNIETSLTLQGVKTNWTYLGEEDTPLMLGKVSTRVDELDLILIRELEADPRRTITRLADTIGIHRTAVSRRLQRLFDENVIRVIAQSDISVLGYNVAVTIMIKAHPGMISEVSCQIAHHKNVPQVIITAGAFDLIAVALFRDLAEMQDFLIIRLGSISGIVSYETGATLKVVKSTYSLLSESNKLPSSMTADDISEF